MHILILLTLHGLGNDNFLIYYPSGYKEEALMVFNYLNYYKPHVDSLTGNNPKKTFVVIEDIGLASNGFADPTRYATHLFSNIPYPDFRFGTMRGWWREVSVHEYTHISHLTNVGGLISFLHRFFGRILIPNVMAPMAMIEGITVSTESSIVPYEGRLNEGYYDPYTTLLASKNALPSFCYLYHIPENYPSYSLPYIIGGEFTRFLKGEDSIVPLINVAWEKHLKRENLRKYYTEYGKNISQLINYDVAAIKVYKSERIKLYNKWREKRYIKSSFRDAGKELYSSTRLNYLFAMDNYIYFYMNKPYDLSYNSQGKDEGLYRLNAKTKKIEKIATGTIPLPIKSDKGIIYYTLAEMEKNGKNTSYLGFRFTRRLYALNNRRKRFILQDDIRSYAVKNNILYYTKALPDKKGCTIYKYNLDTKKKTIFLILDSLLIQDMTFFDDTTIYAIGHIDGWGNNLYKISTTKNTLKPITNVEYSFSYLNTYQNELYFSSNYLNRWQTYKYNPKEHKFYKIETGDFSTAPCIIGNKLYYISLRTDGEAIRQTDATAIVANNFLKKDKNTIPHINHYSYKKKSTFENFKDMIIPDLILPYIYSYEPVILNLLYVTHDPFEINSLALELSFNLSSNLPSFTLNYSFKGIPYTPLNITFLYNENILSTFSINHILYISKINLIRSLTIYSNTIYNSNISNISVSDINIWQNAGLTLNLYLNSVNTLNFYSGLNSPITHFNPTDIVYGTGINLKTDLLHKAIWNNGIAFSYGSGSLITLNDSLITGTKRGKFVSRLTFPLFSPMFGIDFPHFFIEKVYGSFLFEYAIADTITSFAFAAYITPKFSIISGYLKLTPSIGIGYSNLTHDIFLYTHFPLNLNQLTKSYEIRKDIEIPSSIEYFKKSPFIENR